MTILGLGKLLASWSICPVPGPYIYKRCTPLRGESYINIISSYLRQRVAIEMYLDLLFMIYK